MKLQQAQAAPLEPTNVETVARWSKKPLENTPYYALVLALADMFDDIADGSNLYVTMGCTMKRESLMIRFKAGDTQDSEYAETFGDLAVKCKRFIDFPATK